MSYRLQYLFFLLHRLRIEYQGSNQQDQEGQVDPNRSMRVQQVPFSIQGIENHKLFSHYYFEYRLEDVKRQQQGQLEQLE